MDFVPDIAAGHGQLIAGDGWAIETLHTPGTPPTTRLSR
jgi:hypothetical protein